MREGYKKTEVGIIPDDWEVKSKFINIFSGNGFKLNEYVEDGIPLIRINNVTHGKLLDNDWKYLPHEYRDNYNSYLIKRGDILLALNRPITRGKLKICSVDIDEAILYQRVGKLSMDESKFSSKYYYYYMQSSLFMKKLEAGLVGTDQPYIKNSEFKEIEFIVPPLKEQEKIAEILSTVDSQIDDTGKLIEKSKQLKKGLIQKLLTKGIGHSEFKKTEVGEISVEWEVKRLDSLCELIDGDRSSSYPNGDDIVEDGIIFLSTSNIKNNKLDYSNLKFITEEKFKTLRKGKLEKNDIIITLRGSIGSVARFDNDNYETGFINAQMLIIRPKLVNSNYLHNYLTSFIFKKQLEIISSGSAQPQLTKRDLSSIKIVLPSNSEQEKISKILLSIDNEIEEYKNKKQKLEDVKKGLMQQLLTGKIRTVI